MTLCLGTGAVHTRTWRAPAVCRAIAEPSDAFSFKAGIWRGRAERSELQSGDLGLCATRDRSRDAPKRAKQIPAVAETLPRNER